MKPAIQNGFSLIEMAIVLMIVGLLLGGMLVPLTAQMEQRNISDTQKALSEIKEAIIGFTLANGRMPCPADPTIATGSINAGKERATCTTTANSTGALPWATLGVNETDAWGNRYTYRVTSDFADAIGNSTYGGCTPSPIPTLASFGLCSVGNLNVWSSAAKVTTIAASVPAVIISHGKNGAGAYTTKGIQLAVGSNADEQENSDGNADTDYVSHTINSTFDDLVAWISPNILFNRMVTAGKLP
jgi:prepilin-type N-terminal cleavage/methylation domain-containing protein